MRSSRLHAHEAIRIKLLAVAECWWGAQLLILLIKPLRSYKQLAFTTESLAARATMSAQETVLGHCSSTLSLMLLMIWKASALRVRFGVSLCSPGPLVEPSSNTDASQPYIITHTHTHKKNSSLHCSHIQSSCVALVIIKKAHT